MKTYHWACKSILTMGAQKQWSKNFNRANQLNYNHMLTSTNILGVMSIGAGLFGWWTMAQGILEGKIEFTTRGSSQEIWYSQAGSPNAFWMVILFYFAFGIFCFCLGYFILRKSKLTNSSK